MEKQFSLGLFDRLFGEKTQIEVPGKGGKVLYRTVTKKWLDKMIQDRKMSVIVDTVRVHLIDPFEDNGHTVTHWKIGEDIDKDTVDKFLDSETKDLYAIKVYENGKPSTIVVKKEIFNKGIAELEKLR